MDMEKFFDLTRSHLELQDRRSLEQLDLQDRRHQEQMRALTALVEKSSAGSAATIGVNSTATPNFSAFDSTSELLARLLIEVFNVPESPRCTRVQKTVSVSDEPNGCCL